MVAAVVGVALVAAACGDDDDAGSATTTAAAASETTAASVTTSAGVPTTAGDDEATTTAAAGSDTTEAAADDTAGGEPATLRLGYFPNVTHAPAIVGVAEGTFAEALGSNVDLELSTFNAGTDVIEALFSDALDATFIGPNPAINGYAKSEGDALRIVAGTTSGGASLVVKPGHQLRRRPQGQDAVDAVARQHPGRRPALAGSRSRAWRPTRAAAVTSRSSRRRTPTPSTPFSTGAIDGAWVPEPWATRLVDGGRRQGAGRRGGPVAGRPVRHDPPDRRRTYLEDHPDVVKHLIEGLVDDDRPDRGRPGRGPDGRQRGARASSPASPSPTPPSRAPSTTSRSRSTRSPRRCKRRPTTPRPSACSIPWT